MNLMKNNRSGITTQNLLNETVNFILKMIDLI